MTGLSDQGLTIKRLDEIKQELDDGLKVIFGQELSLDPSTPESQLNGIIAEDIAILYEIAQGVYTGLNPNTSTGNMLDLVSGIRGIIRKPATTTTADVVFTGTNGVVVPKGTLFNASGIPNITFSLDEEVTLPADGSVTCDEVGLIALPADTLTIIVNPISGLTSVNNPLDGLTGTEIETDEELRRRANVSVSSTAVAILDGMIAAISAIPNVTAVSVIENNTNIVDAITGVSPKSMHAVVRGGSDEDIAEAIFNTKSVGCGMDGSVELSVADVNGYPNQIRFDRPTSTDIHVLVDVKELSGWDPAIVESLKQDVVDYANGLTSGCTAFGGYAIGQDVYASHLYNAYVGATTFVINSIKVGAISPGSEEVVVINQSETAFFTTANVIIESAP